ncbi:unnamed protein product [Clonostachys rosea f. rosea IK726]|uniref:Uncharacterized protein n=1 Tax=Clonostachys rosea f. rosea IK726 TaxID=1349383 RepID=A0ACA9TRV0_BIOOC|nr:unnamed protein product [Clonostachys rosea f. rosea IK726]
MLPRKLRKFCLVMRCDPEAGLGLHCHATSTVVDRTRDDVGALRMKLSQGHSPNVVDAGKAGRHIPRNFKMLGRLDAIGDKLGPAAASGGDVDPWILELPKLQNSSLDVTPEFMQRSDLPANIPGSRVTRFHSVGRDCR